MSQCNAAMAKCCCVAEVTLYNPDSVFGRIAGSNVFILVGMVVTMLFLMWQGIDVDHNSAGSILHAAPMFQLAYYFFLSYFAGEIIVRFLGVKEKAKAVKCPALIWDFILLIFLIIGPIIGFATDGEGGPQTARVMQRMHILQLTRLLRWIPLQEVKELTPVSKPVAVIKGVGLIVGLVYVFALSMTMMTRDTEVGYEYFSTVSESMQSICFRLSWLSRASEVTSLVLLYLVFVGLEILVAALTVLTLKQPSGAAPVADAKDSEAPVPTAVPKTV